MRKIFILGLVLIFCNANYGKSIAVDDSTNYFIVPGVFYPDIETDENNFVVKVVDSIKIDSFGMQIFNRWGSKVFETNCLAQKWDGKTKKEKLPAGTYVYIISAILFDKSDLNQTFNVNQTGVLNIIR